jgi:flavin-dependent dehydrogenase
MNKRLVIVGGGAGGPSAAAEAKRRNPSLEVVMLEAGEFVSYAA